MKVIERFNVNKPPEGPRTFTFQLSGAGVASVAVVGVLCLVWVFILGVLVGRGYKPESAVPELAQMMPSSPAPSASEQKEPPTVLKPEELQFMENLQGKKPTETVTVDSSKKPGDKPADAQTSAQPPAAPVAAPPTSSLEKTPAPLPKGQVATATAQPDRKATVSSSESRRDKSPAQPAKDKKDKEKDKSRKDKNSKDASKDKDKKDKKEKDKDKASAKSKAKEKDQAKAKENSSKRYKVTFQVSSIEDRKQAEHEADRLTKMGMSSHVEEANVGGKTFYRVILRVRGNEGEIKSALDQAGAKKPIQREKKPL